MRHDAARVHKDADLVQGRRVYDAARMRVALFSTCLVDALFPDAGKATVTLLERLGQPLEFPLEQTCCGQMHANSGYFEPNLVRRYVDVFEPYDAVVVPSGSCAGAIRHQHAMVARATGDETLARRAHALGEKTYELTQFLIDVLHTDDVGAYFPHRVTYHPTCHSLRMLGVGDRPLRLLNNVRGIELVDAPPSRRVLRVRRNVLDQEPGRVGGDARRQDGGRDRDGRRGAVRRRPLVPDAHRRRP